MIVAFQGEPGAYSEEALRLHFRSEPDLATLPCRSLPELFAQVERRAADCGMLPFENSLGGTVTGVNTLLLNHDLKASAEIHYAVKHNLLVVPGCQEAVTHVRSHPQALEQCRGYLAARQYQPVDWYDTAGAAKALADDPEPRYAAIASRYAAQCYGLEIAEAGIEDERNNLTRFLVIGHEEAAPADDCKTSVLFAVADKPGALVEALQIFAARGINLTNISSFPRRTRQWNYVFYMDFLGHFQDARVNEALMHLLARAAFVKLLGSYPRARPPADADVRDRA